MNRSHFAQNTSNGSATERCGALDTLTYANDYGFDWLGWLGSMGLDSQVSTRVPCQSGRPQ